MRLIKNKQFKLLFILPFMIVGLLTIITLPSVNADYIPLTCDPPAQKVVDQYGTPSCKCPSNMLVQVDGTTNKCVSQCQNGTVQTQGVDGQTYCNQQLQCADGSNAPNNNVNQCDSVADPAEQCSRSSCDIFKKYLNPAINLLSALVGLIVVGSVIAGAIQYSASEGDPQKAAKAKTRIMNSVVALVAFIFLSAFLQWIIPGGLLNK